MFKTIDLKLDKIIHRLEVQPKKAPFTEWGSLTLMLSI
ncbi:hypothetical protein VFA_001576 [Vibrio furnissii CIP 102972]|nr:hypothetical protein vfu_A01994 [Vibrio furnissii NCTC 11218]EEX41739.1 hypothetical protein VFA_001576 [Vibrio furnissii CIP 102972]